MSKKQTGRPAPKASGTSTPKAPARRRTLILTGRGKKVLGWINADGTVSR